MSDNLINISQEVPLTDNQWESKKYHFSFNGKEIQLLIPDSNVIHHYYLEQKESDGKNFYWARLWPASVALCHFLADNINFIQDKRVAELAAGLGLPSLLAAHYAREVECSDYNNHAVEVMRQSVVLNKLYNVKCTLIDWHLIPVDFFPEVILFSDINYAPEEFQVLQNLIINFIQKGILIILCTPQRLVAKAFVEPLLPYCIKKENLTIDISNTQTETTVFVLRGA